ncbi:MAG: hypothetical protein ACYDC1_06285 [Limisphaerales bacterium]
MPIPRKMFTALNDRFKAFCAKYGDGANHPGFAVLDGLGHTTDENGQSTQVDLTQRVREFIRCAIKDDPDHAKALLRDVWAGTPGAMQSLNAIRIETVDNFLLPDADLATGFFEIINLLPNEVPVVHHTTRQQVNVAYLADGGQPRHMIITPDMDEVKIPLNILASDSVDYRPRDIYLGGDGAENAWKTVEIAFDLAVKADQAAMTLLDSAMKPVGSPFNYTTGKRSRRVFVPHSGIVTANLPTHNDIVLAGNTGSTKFRVEVLQAALKYSDSWGKRAATGELRPTGVVYVPSSETTDILTSFDTTGSVGNPTADSVFANYMHIDHGIRWTIIPSNRLPLGKCWVQLNQKVGRIYTKTSYDVSHDSMETPEGRKKAILTNRAERQMFKVWTPYVLDQSIPNALRITYHS